MDYIYRFFKFLVKKRRVYIAFSILISLGIIYYLRQNVPMEANEYTCAVALNNINDKEKYINNDPQSYNGYRPSWQIENPFNFDNLYNHFQSTSFLNEAGDKINYRVRYTHKGIDIYDERPFDIYVEYNNKYSDNNSFETYIEQKNGGVVLKKTKGYINGEKVKLSEELFLAYDTPKDTPIGRISITKRTENNNWDKNYSVKVNYFDRNYMNILFDKNMTRSIQGNIIICELKSDYTFEFVKNLFNSMVSTYVDNMKAKYTDDYNKYVAKIDSILVTMESGDPMYNRFKELKELANYDYQIINKGNIISFIDKPYISDKNILGIIGKFRYFVVVFVFLLFPVFLLLIELFIRPININISDLPKKIKENVIYHVDKSTMTDLDKSNIAILLKNCGDVDMFVSSISHRCFPADKFIKEIRKHEDIKLKSCVSLDKSYAAINDATKNYGNLVILLNLGSMTLMRLKKLQDVLIKSKVNIFVILFE